MADPLERSDFRDVGIGLEEAEMNPERQLPEPGNRRLNRTAEQIGGTLGKVVSQARRAPNSAKRGLHVVRDRAQEATANATNSASSLAEMAQQRAKAIAEEAQQRGAQLVDAAEARGRELLDKADAVTRDMANRATQMKQQLEDRGRELQQAARLRAQQARINARRLLQERPLQVLGGIAAAAFIAGVSLRIVRSRNASRY